MYLSYDLEIDEQRQIEKSAEGEEDKGKAAMRVALLLQQLNFNLNEVS